MFTATLMLLGSGELGREFAIAAKRLGCRVIACDRYVDAPAMQLSDASEVFPMLDGAALRAAVEKHRPDVIVPEIEAIDTDALAKLEAEGWRVAPSARAVQLTMNRDGIRDFAARELGLVTSKYRFAESRDEAVAAADDVGLPCVVKPVMSSSGKGQSVARTAAELGEAWDHAVANMRGDRPRVIVEEFITFDSEITLLTVATSDGIKFCAPVGHRQEAGDYRHQLATRADPARGAPPRRGTSRARWSRPWAVTAFSESNSSSCGDQAIFSELSPAPPRHRDGHPDLAIPQRVRASPARDPRPAHSVDRARRALGLGGHPRRRRNPKTSPTRGLKTRCGSVRRENLSTSGSSASRRPSRTAAWGSRWPAATRPMKRSNAPSLQLRGSKFVMANEKPAARGL